MSSLLATAAVSDAPKITISKPAKFACEVRNSEGKDISFSGQFENWAKHERNDSGNIEISSGQGLIPGGSFVAIARGRDVSFSNYVSNSVKPTRMAMIIGDLGKATITVEVKTSLGSALATHLFAGFCTGKFTGIGAA